MGKSSVRLRTANLVWVRKNVIYFSADIEKKLGDVRRQ
jgi:hypothetical protein